MGLEKSDREEKRFRQGIVQQFNRGGRDDVSLVSFYFRNLVVATTIGFFREMFLTDQCRVISHFAQCVNDMLVELFEEKPRGSRPSIPAEGAPLSGRRLAAVGE